MGLLLEEIGADSKDKGKLHYSFKKNLEIESLTDLSNQELYEYIQEVIVFIESDMGIELEKRTLKELFDENRI